MEQSAGADQADQARDRGQERLSHEQLWPRLQPSLRSLPPAFPRGQRERTCLWTCTQSCWRKTPGCGQSWRRTATSRPPSFCSSRRCR